MLRIGLISDTHGYLDKKVQNIFQRVDEIWHAGDLGTIELCNELKNFKPLIAVYGNIDGKEIRIEYPPFLFFEKEGFKILITHIGGYPNNYAPAARYKIETLKPDIFICGHSHILKVVRDLKYNNMLVINPGAAGIQGFHQVKTVIRFTLNNKKIENFEVIELGKRGEL